MYIEYIEEGEGKWELITNYNKTNRKKKFNSDGTPEVLDIEHIDKYHEEPMDKRQLELYEIKISRTNQFLLKVKDYIEDKVRKN